jgi:hypothetical protein
VWSVQTEGNCPGRNSSVRSGIRFSLFDSLLQLIAPEQRVRIGEFRPGHPEPVVRRFHLKCLVEATTFESLSAQQKSMVKRQLEKVIKIHLAFVFTSRIALTSVFPVFAGMRFCGSSCQRGIGCERHSRASLFSSATRASATDSISDGRFKELEQAANTS